MAVIAPLPKRAIFTDEQNDYRESYARFLQNEVVPHYAEWRKNEIVPKSLFTKCAEYGFLAMEVPEEYGGPGVEDWRFNVVLGEEAVAAGVADAMAGPLLHSDVVLPYLMASATEEQKQRWLPDIAAGRKVLAIAMTEPGTGSDLAGIKTSAKRFRAERGSSENYIVNGSKTFITNGINCDMVVVAVRTSEDKHAGLSMLVIEDGMPGFTKGKQIEKLGQHASDTSELFFDDCVVPADNLLGAEGTGFFQLVGRLVPERLILSVSSMAGCEAALAMTLDYVKDRKAFGKPIGSFQHSRFTLAELKTKVEISRCFVDRCIERYVGGTCTVEEAAMAKYWTTDLLCEITDAGVQLHGGYGYTKEYAIGKAWVDARVGRIYAGTNEIMKELIGKTMGL
jgi:alkylation response protein AidB-like acyl-CoA dehydrogenase